jgi:putative ABC transport system substrate-binding protein
VKQITQWSLVAAIIVSAFALYCSAEAQQPKKVPRIGYLSRSRSSLDVEAFRQGLRDLGYIEGQTITIEYASSVAEAVQLKVDVIVVSGSPSTQAAKSATRTIPIVMTNVNDPVELGVVASLAHPGGNITGLSNVGSDLGGKQLELLKEAFPVVSRVAVLWESANAGNALWLGEMKIAAERLRVTLQPVEIHGRDDFERAFLAIQKEHVNGLSALRNAVTNNYRSRIVDFASKSRLAAVYPEREFVEIGGLMSYGPNFADLFRRAATYVDKILRGAKPAALPVEQPTKFELVINLKSAKEIGLAIPPNVLARADRVIR